MWIYWTRLKKFILQKFFVIPPTEQTTMTHSCHQLISYVEVSDNILLTQSHQWI